MTSTPFSPASDPPQSNIRGAEHFLVVARGWDHLTLRDVSTVERLRKDWLDSEIVRAACYPKLCKPSDRALAGQIIAARINPDSIVAYLRRNPRSIPGAA